MQYKINTKAFHEAFKEPSAAFYKNWTCPVHGARDYCSHYTEAFEKFKSEFMKKFIEPYTPQSLKPVGIHIAKKLVAPDGYEYGWKTVYNRVDNRVERICSNNSDYEATYRPPFHFELDEAALKNLLFVGWIPVGWLYPTYKIPRNADGFYADGDAVLCMRIKNNTKAELAAKNEGGKISDIETLVDRTDYSMGNNYYLKKSDMPYLPALQNELGVTDEQTKAIVEHAKKHIVPGWEDNEANRIARKAIENMDRLESLGLSKQDANYCHTDTNPDTLIYVQEVEDYAKSKGLDPRELDFQEMSALVDEILDSRKKAKERIKHEFKDEDMIHPHEIEQMCKEKGLDYDNLSGDNCEMICTEIMGKRKLDKLYSSIHDEPVPVEPIPEFPGERYIKYLKAINNKTNDGFSFDEAYEIVGQDYPEFRDACDESADAKGYTYVRCKELKLKVYTYTGADAEVWAPIMESMESNIAKANALEKVKESFPFDALTLIMGYHFGKHTADEMDDKRIDFVEKYRSLITDMGYSRF